MIPDAEKAGRKPWKPLLFFHLGLAHTRARGAGYRDLEVADDTGDTREDLQHHRTGDR